MATTIAARQDKARRSFDRRRSELVAARQSAARPAGGWLRGVREALGMTAADLAAKLDVAASSVTRAEQSEVAGRIRLDTLERTADALGCDLVYLLVPRRPLEDVVDEQARRLARVDLAALGHTMDLEEQGLTAVDARDLEDELVTTLKASPGLWRDEP